MLYITLGMILISRIILELIRLRKQTSLIYTGLYLIPKIIIKTNPSKLSIRNFKGLAKFTYVTTQIEIV